MEKRIKYSVLRYSSERQVGEAINLGILIADEENQLVEFVYSKKRNRIKVFDDELNYSVVLNLLKSIESEVKDIKDANKEIDVDKFVTYYINAFQFDAPKYLIYNDFEESVEELKKVYLWFDYDKTSRISKKDSVKFLKQIIESKGEKTYSRKSDIGEYKDEIYYDIQTEKYNIVLFDLNKKNISRQINTAKTWSWNAKHHSPDKEVLYVLRTNDLQKSDYTVLQHILDDSGVDVLEYDDAIKRIAEGA